jgi:pyruvate dehydrogenase E1 component beta subunit
MRRLTGKDVPIPYNPHLEAAAVPQVDDIVQEIQAIIQNKY